MSDKDDADAKGTPPERPAFDAVRFEILLHVSTTTIDSNTGVDGTTEEVGAYEQGIKDRLARGDTWAWCFIVVVARYGNYTGIATMNEGIYHDREEFERSEEYDQLRAGAYNELLKNMMHAAGQDVH